LAQVLPLVHILSVRPILLVWVLSCFGCATQVPKSLPQSGSKISGQVTGGLVEASASERYVAEPGARYHQPIAFPDNPLPAYPVDLLSKRLPPVAVQVRVIVDSMGNVSSVVALERSDPDQAQFFESIRSTVKFWKFTQLVKIVPGPGSTTLTDVNSSETTYAGSATALPFHQDYRFVFSQTQGKANVTAHSGSDSGS
jgi:hypothetical protein